MAEVDPTLSAIALSYAAWRCGPAFPSLASSSVPSISAAVASAAALWSSSGYTAAYKANCFADDRDVSGVVDASSAVDASGTADTEDDEDSPSTPAANTLNTSAKVLGKVGAMVTVVRLCSLSPGFLTLDVISCRN